MNRRNLICIFSIAFVYLWLVTVRIPDHLSILNDASRTSYDTYIGSQEFLIRKQLANMDKQKAVPINTKLDSDEALANVLWGSRRFDEALKLYKLVRLEREKISKGYNEKLINTLLSLAGIYRDLNNLEEANSCYEKVWQLDKMLLPKHDARLARDQSCLALIAYLHGEQEIDTKKRQQYFKHCLQRLDDTQLILQSQAHPRISTMANLLYLKFLASRELGETIASNSYKKQADYLTKTLKRPYVAPWS